MHRLYWLSQQSFQMVNASPRNLGGVEHRVTQLITVGNVW
jgi:hypothetical protein